MSLQEAFKGAQVVIPPFIPFAMFLMGTIVFLYFTILEYYIGQTIGKKILGLYVSGNRTIKSCMIRNLFAFPIFPFRIFWILDPLFIIIKKERLLERWSKTNTVQVIDI